MRGIGSDHGDKKMCKIYSDSEQIYLKIEIQKYIDIGVQNEDF